MCLNESAASHKKFLASNGFYDNDDSRMPTGPYHGRPFAPILPSLTGFVPNMQLISLMNSYKQQPWLAGFNGMQNPLATMTSLNLFPTATKPIIQSFGGVAGGKLPFGSSNFPLHFPSQSLSPATTNNYMCSPEMAFPNNAIGFPASVQARNLAAMTSSGIFPSSGTKSAVVLSQSLSSSPAQSNNSSSSPYIDVSSNATSNMFSVAMQKQNSMKLADMMQKYQQMQAASKNFQNMMQLQQLGLPSNNISFPSNARFPSNASFHPMLFNHDYSKNNFF